jgi:hypothetical protein
MSAKTQKEPLSNSAKSKKEDMSCYPDGYQALSAILGIEQRGKVKPILIGNTMTTSDKINARNALSALAQSCKIGSDYIKTILNNGLSELASELASTMPITTIQNTVFNYIASSDFKYKKLFKIKFEFMIKMPHGIAKKDMTRENFTHERESWKNFNVTYSVENKKYKLESSYNLFKPEERDKITNATTKEHFNELNKRLIDKYKKVVWRYPMPLCNTLTTRHQLSDPMASLEPPENYGNRRTIFTNLHRAVVANYNPIEHGTRCNREYNEETYSIKPSQSEYYYPNVTPPIYRQKKYDINSILPVNYLKKTQNIPVKFQYLDTEDVIKRVYSYDNFEKPDEESSSLRFCHITVMLNNDMDNVELYLFGETLLKQKETIEGFIHIADVALCTERIA